VRVIVLGAGEVGAHVARELSQEGSEVVLIDRSAEALARAEEQVDALTLRGDVTHRSVLTSAEVGRADLVVAVTGSDDTNVVGAALAASIGAKRTVARVDAPSFYTGEGGVEDGVLGIHALLCASRLVSEELVCLIERLDASFVSNFAGNALQLCLLPLVEGSPALGRQPADVDLAKGANVMGVVRDGALRPAAEGARLEIDDALLLSGQPGAVTRAVQSLHVDRRPRRAVIVGGGDVGYQLCRMLASAGQRVQVIEQDRGRCEFLSESLRDVNVIHGDGTNISCLRDEHVDSADYMVAVTRADEVNLMASLMAKDLGVAHTFALVHRPGYADVYAHLGVHGTAGSHDVIARMVRWLRPHRGPLAVESLAGTGHQLLEFQLGEGLEKSATVADLGLPPETMVVGVARGLLCLSPRPALALAQRDNLVVAAPMTFARDVEKRVARLGGRR
jgi:trk system potassium uptake protein TrkA